MTTRLLATLLVVLMLAALFVGGAQPEAVGLVPDRWDKLAHVAYFLVFALLLARFVSLPILLVVVFSLAIGAADEIHQSFLPGRIGSWEDWLADVLGTGAGVAVSRLVSAKSLPGLRPQIK